jgi:methionyl-tRNA formyltransferase
MKRKSSAVAHEAERLGLRLEKPPTLGDATLQTMLREIGADVMVVAAYGLLLPRVVLEMPKFGCLNIHGSLLPRWRGAAPVQRAIESGDTETGITIMQMDTSLDTGAVLLVKKIPITPDETSASLFDKLTPLGSSAIVEALETLATLTALPQSPDGVAYAGKIDKLEARIDWTQPAAVIERRIRAFDPFPGCEARLGNEPLKIWRARVVGDETAGALPGTVTTTDRQTVTVKCGQQQLQLITLQKPGGKRVATSEFLLGAAIANGTRLS